MNMPKDSRLLQALVPAVRVAADGCAEVEQARIPAEVEALEAALLQMQKVSDSDELPPTPGYWALYSAIGFLKKSISKRRRASTGGNEKLSDCP